ncbi:MAG: class I SAM-dependent methyltransferase [Gammaproteobacteria bacterium]|nr:class I SAM-dependent methyltransferase [Gammaproteobacteria bacterium]
MTGAAQQTNNSKAKQGLAAGNFRHISVRGFGDAYNSYPHSMAWFRDHLYVGTTRAVLAHRGRWCEMEGSIGWSEITWPVRTPESSFDFDLRAEIWRYSPKNDSWVRVYIAPLVKGKDGFDVPRSISFRAMLVFKGHSDPAPGLYVPTMGSHQNPEALMLRSVDGTHFEEVTEPGMRFPQAYSPRGVRALTEYKNLMFTAPAVGAKARESNTAGHMVIAVNADPARDEWRLACEPNFGNSNNLTVFDMAVFSGCLYAGTMNPNEGFQIWKTTAEGNPPYQWKMVLNRGAYRGKLNQIAMTLTTFNGHLYVGSCVQRGGYDPDNKVGPAASEIIRIHPDDNWNLVVGEPRYTPDGLKVPLSGLGPGFGKFSAGYLWSLCVHEGWLYAGTFDWLMSLPYKNTDNWPENIRRTFSYAGIEDLILDYGGCDIWRTRDGCLWIPVTHNGFNNFYNYGARTMVSTPDGLFVGMANPFGPEVAVMRKAGWRYEENPRGGLEIWLGSRDIHSARQQPIINSTTNSGDVNLSVSLELDGSVEDDALTIVQHFCGSTGYSHLGYWRKNLAHGLDACENLLAEVLAFIPDEANTIVDLGCGSGATTSFLRKRFPADSIKGLTSDPKKLRTCRETAGEISFSRMNPGKLKLASQSTDSVIWISGQDILDRRDKLIAEACRILKPGGHLACFETISPNTIIDETWPPKGEAVNIYEAREIYEKILVDAGFKEIRIFDVTEVTRTLTIECFNLFVTPHKLSKQVDDEMIEAARELLFGIDPMVCLLISALRG